MVIDFVFCHRIHAANIDRDDVDFYHSQKDERIGSNSRGDQLRGGFFCALFGDCLRF